MIDITRGSCSPSIEPAPEPADRERHGRSSCRLPTPVRRIGRLAENGPSPAVTRRSGVGSLGEHARGAASGSAHASSSTGVPRAEPEPRSISVRAIATASDREHIRSHDR